MAAIIWSVKNYNAHTPRQEDHNNKRMRFDKVNETRACGHSQDLCFCGPAMDKFIFKKREKK